MKHGAGSFIIHQPLSHHPIDFLEYDSAYPAEQPSSQRGRMKQPCRHIQKRRAASLAVPAIIYTHSDIKQAWNQLAASALEEHPLYAGALFRQAGVFQAFLHSPAPVRTVPVIAISARTAKHEAHLCGQLTLCPQHMRLAGLCRCWYPPFSQRVRWHTQRCLQRLGWRMHANETAGRDQGVLRTHFSNISFIDVQLVDIPKMKMHGGKKKKRLMF